MLSIQITTPSRGSIDHEHLECVDEFIKLAREPNAAFKLSVSRMYGCSLIDHARSRLATNFCTGDRDVLLWIDDDMVFDPHEAIRICQEALERQAIVGAVCSTKKPMGNLTAKFGEEIAELGFFKKGGIYPALTVGCGLTAVHRSVFEELIKKGVCPPCNDAKNDPLYPFYLSMIDADNVWWGEDTSFCLRAKSIGVQTFVDTRARVGHKGSYVYHVEDTASAVQLHGALVSKLVSPDLPRTGGAG